ncbi:hypothetical protein QR680_009022 [Steinernema hermaphroditum]|uniref:Midasin n=1 Tax=Steinernema hermaphroditum TaxID=289476 RepID=A0AA39M949_9BILA|nr:hypothetical protein QR680_009022 [Steinernema hermaphroditum]
MGPKRKNRKRKADVPESASPTQSSSASSSRAASDAPTPSKEIKIEVVETLPTRYSIKETISAFFEKDALLVLKGPIGCGKTSVIREIAQSRNLPLRIIQMGDQLDAKVLFGSYHCTEIPGDFVWKPSNFTKYLREECILLLEDLDCALVDLISAVVTLCEKREQVLPSGEKVVVKPTTKIIATVRTSMDKKTLSPIFNGTPCHVELPPFSDDELRRIICVKYPRLNSISKKLVSIFTLIRTRSAEDRKSTKRQLTSTDLFRVCARLQQTSDLTSNINVIIELIDVLAMHPSSKDMTQELAASMAELLNVTTDELDFVLRKRQPEISSGQDSLKCGRGVLTKRGFSTTARNLHFGVTRDVCQLMERLAFAVQHNEPVLLSGETGVGKTTVVQTIANYLNAKLHVVNLSQHSDSSDLIGGFKPVSVHNLLQPLRDTYDEMFEKCFDRQKNAKFFEHMDTCLSTGRYVDFVKLIAETAKKALQKNNDDEQRHQWAEVLVRANRFNQTLMTRALPFAYVSGVVAEAAEKGEWLLIDEINLASSECLDAIVQTLDDVDKTRHPDFRLFACMNPATDTGKRNLAIGVRARFTEFFVHETTDPEQLAIIIRTYLPTLDAQKLQQILNLFVHLCKLIPKKYSLRTLCRALSFAADNMFGTEMRSLYEAFHMSFVTDLDAEHTVKVEKVIVKSLGKVQKTKLPRPSSSDKNYVEVEGYWLEQGPLVPSPDTKFVLTPSVKKKLAQLARVVCSGRYPVLLEGETSAGKTSMVTYLAQYTGNRVVRINNHEHTDLQEYIGSYSPDRDGKLQFAEGALLKAVRNGDWVILDELNLAPTDVIEALNRLLDDNRELFVSELNVAVRAHPSFRLFATQNPVGAYAGRKKLSRALLNRFVLLRFDHLPFSELTEMVCARCAVAPSSASKMIAVLGDLRIQRSLMGVFSARDGLMTLRDVFRWAGRLAASAEGDWQQILADQGYMLLAGRCRSSADEKLVKETLEKHLKRSIKPEAIFAMNSTYMPKISESKKDVIVWTYSMRRMAVLCYQAWLCDEPVLMVGETGCGKTTIAQKISKGDYLFINCHERTETADLLGRLRPLSDGTFQWKDGVVVEAMKKGKPLLIDEISLAADSVLERLNPLLESSRSLYLTDAGTSAEAVSSTSGFQVVATMNPGGDYGKKELSKALRNRFTEFWCAGDLTGDDLAKIIQKRLRCDSVAVNAVAMTIVEFVAYFTETFAQYFRRGISIRDIVALVDVFNSCVQRAISPSSALFHAFHTVLLDCLAMMQPRMNFNKDNVVNYCLDQLSFIAKQQKLMDNSEKPPHFGNIAVSSDDLHLCVSEFKIPYGSEPAVMPAKFSFDAPTCRMNLFRLSRALSIEKPILLEGAPGCGKSSTIVALAKATGNRLVRLNLSDQTDVNDLFGSDIPVVLDDGGVSFRWQDGPVLKAIKEGCWILLDEMNLASQSVLEGLNSCFDHRKQLYIAELNRTFDIDTRKCRFFACQNPRSQGGNRRALPKSFVNRFISIYTEELTESDERLILEKAFPEIESEKIAQMVEINQKIRISMDDGWHMRGAPFEFNLRDLIRWAEIVLKTSDLCLGFSLLYLDRMRVPDDKAKMSEIFRSVFDIDVKEPIASISLSEKKLVIGPTSLTRSSCATDTELRLLPCQMSLLLKLALCVDMNWLALLVGPHNAGKRSVIENLAVLTGSELHHMRLTSETDALELLGTYEQVTDFVDLERIRAEVVRLVDGYVCDSLVLNVREADDILKLRTSVACAAELMTDDKKKLRLEELVDQLCNNCMRFEWFNSKFLDAYMKGDWIVIEDVNCCSAAVLDRLNTCLESNGELTLSERGDLSSKPITAHPNFRVFFTMDPTRGSISRAMRNRSVEISVESRWMLSPDDLGNVIGSALSLTACEQLVQAVARQELTSGDILALTPLLKSTGSLESALKRLNREQLKPLISNVEEAASLPHEPCFLAPSVNKELISNVFAWKLEAWLRDCGDQDRLWAFVLALFSLSPVEIFSGRFCQRFKNSGLDANFIDSVLSFLKKILTDADDALPWDGRLLNHQLSIGIDCELRNKCILGIMCLWFSRQLESLEAQNGSPASVSLAFLNKRLRSDQLESPVLKTLSSALNETVSMFKSHVLPSLCETGIGASLTGLWNFVIFAHCAAEPSSERTGLVLLQLAWQYLKGNFLDIHFSSTTLMKHLNTIGASWNLKSEEDMKRFTEFNEKWQVAVAFKGLEAWQLAHETIRSIHVEEPGAGEAEPMEDDIIQPTSVTPVFDSPLKALNGLAIAIALLNVNSPKEFAQAISVVKTHDLKSLNALSCFEWSNGAAEKLLFYSTYFNSEFCVSEFSENLRNVNTIGASLLTELMANILFAFNYDTNIRSISLENLNTFTDDLNRLKSIMWKLLSHFDRFEEHSRAKLDYCIQSCVTAASMEGDVKGTIENALNWINVGFSLMEQATPAINMIDPLIREEQNQRYLEMRLELIESQLRTLKNFKKTTSGDALEGRNLRDSKHPWLASLLALEEETIELLHECKQKSAKNVYRPEYSAFTWLTNELNGFYQMATEWKQRAISRAQMGGNWRYWSTQDLDIHCSQLDSFLVSARSFVKRLTTEFSPFPDIIHPFIASVNLVMIAVNCQLKEARSIGAVRAQAALEFVPQSVEITDTEYGKLPKVEALFAWSISTKSTMPVRLQQRIIRRLLSQGKFEQAFSWISTWWKRWHDAHVEKKEKMYVYRKKASGTGEDGEEVIDDEDEIMMEELFPKFSDEDEEAMDVDKDANPLEDYDLFEIVSSLLTKEEEFSDSNLYLPLMWLLCKASAKDVSSVTYSDILKPFHLDHLTSISAYGTRNSVELNKKKSRKKVIDVYHENDSAEILRSVKAVKSLEVLVRSRLDEWPEVAALRSVLASIFRFLASSSTLPLLQLATHLERILMEAEHWEKVAHRGNTLEEGLSPLRHILVDWRKMEVICWDNILNKVESDSAQIAMLLAYPLVEAVFDEGSEDKPRKTPMDILAMMIEWIQNGSLMDYSARLQSVRIVAACARSSPKCHVMISDSKFPDKAESIARHFEQFVSVVKTHLDGAKSPIEQQLKDFVRIVQFKDLNLANVRASAQKAHRQLFTLVKAYRNCGNEPIAPFIDQLAKVGVILDDVPLAVPNLLSSTSNYALRMGDMCREIAEKLEESVDSERIDDIMKTTAEYDTLIRTQIMYEGEDEEKEKQQGRAVNKRQQGFAYLIKELGSVGIKGRRGLTVNAEQLSAQSVVDVPLDLDSTIEKLFRHASSSRSILTKLSHKPHQQLSVSVIKHITGISEFLLKWLYNASLQTVTFSGLSQNIQDIVDFVVRHFKNLKNDCTPVNYCAVKLNLERISVVLSELSATLECCEKIVMSAPETPGADDAVFNRVWSLSGILDSCLSSLNKQHPEYNKVLGEIRNSAFVLTTMADKIARHAGSENQKSLFSVDMGELNADLDVICENFELVSSLPKLVESWLPNESSVLTEKCSILKQLLDDRSYRSSPGSEETLESVNIEVHPVLLAAQTLYKGIVSNVAMFEELEAIDSAKAISEMIVQAKLEEVVSVLHQPCSQLAWGAPCSKDFNLQEFVEVSTKLLEMFGIVRKRFDRFVCGAAVLYIKFESVGAQLLEKGYVNPIPKVDNQAECGRQGQGNEEGTGMGDGQGENDVTDELDNMGQIEGLKGENEKEGEKPNFQDDKEHVEMDDDFAADLEDIDADDNDKQDNDNDEGNDNEEVDWNMGDVDDSQEDELDPDVWDKPQEEKEKNMDEGTDAAKDKNDELTAASEEDSVPQGQEEKERAGVEGDEEDELPEGKNDQETDDMEENHQENIDERDASTDVNEDKKAEPDNTESAESAEDAGEPDADDINLEETVDDKDGREGEPEEEETLEEENDDADNENDEKTVDNAESEEEAMDETDDATENIENFGGEGVANEEEQQANAENAPREDNSAEKNEKDFCAVGNDDGGKDNEQRVQDDKDEEVVEDKQNDEDTEDSDRPKPRRKLADEMNNEAANGEIVEEQEEDKNKERPENEDDPLAPIRDEENVLHEKQVVDSASLEEAKASRTVDQEKMTHRESRKNVDNQIKDREAIEDEEMEVDESATDGKETEGSRMRELHATEIHTNTDIYNLAATQQALASELDQSEDTEEVDLDSEQDRDRRWGHISNSVSVLSAELAENLRLLIEPTIANKLEGDYKSGKRLNMRRLISYIASDYRKNSIWLRRTKKAQRNYQILIAVDDSKSMSDNKMNEMTCQSVCLIEQALRQLEIGELAICKFGEKVKMLREFGEYHDSGKFGARLLKELGFDQNRTNLPDLLNISASILEKGREEKGGSANQMLIIISDGQGVHADGGNKVRAAVQNLFQSNVTVLFVIVDNITSSVTKMTICNFTGDNKAEIAPYMSKFPFPFYVLVRHISVLPAVIADAIRQWFELTVGSEA